MQSSRACNIYARSGDATGVSWLRVGHGPAVGCAATKWTRPSAMPATRALPVQRKAGVPPVLAASCFRPQCAATSSPNLKGLGHRVGPGCYQSGAGAERGCKVPFSVLRMLMQTSRKPPRREDRRQKAEGRKADQSHHKAIYCGVQSHPKATRRLHQGYTKATPAAGYFGPDALRVRSREVLPVL